MFAPDRQEFDAQARKWSVETRDHWHLPSVAVMEIEQGLSKLSRMGAKKKHEVLTQWLDATLATFSNRIVGFDLESARCAGRLSDGLAAMGNHPGFRDIMIAAVALTHDMIVLTRNVRHFEPTGVPVIDPMSPPPLHA